MKKILFLIILFFIAVSLYAQDFDFRKTLWGMSVKEVANVEKEKLLNKGGDKQEYQLVYKITLADFKGKVLYHFVDYKLVKAHYIFNIKEIDESISNHDFFKEVLIEKYGTPDASKRIFTEEKMRELGPFYFLLLPSKDKVREALENRDLYFKTSWSTSFTYISLLLEKHEKMESYSIRVLYESKRWTDDLLKQEEDRKISREKELYDAI